MNSILRNITRENYQEVVEEAGAAIREGRIVGLPTETVYGLAANREDDGALERLIRLKNRPRGKPFTLHLSDRSEIFRFAPGPHPFAHRLMERYWPGPLTLVLNGHSGGTIGLRVPGLELTRDIIRTAKVPVVLPSANPAGIAPACTASQVLEFYEKEIDLVVDDGKTKIGDPSTVVRIMDDSFHVIRTGIITARDIINTACRKILFVCTGNTCRSPMAEWILKKLIAEKLGCTLPELPNKGYLIQSAGLSSSQGERASLNAIKSIQKWKIDLSTHKTRPVSRSLLEGMDRIFVMTLAHRIRLWEILGEQDPKIELLDRKSRDILDPFGGSESVYSRCASQIYSNLLEIVEGL